MISSNNMGSLEVFALYSYQSQQQALSQIQINMLMVCVALSVLIGMIIFLVIAFGYHSGTAGRLGYGNHGIGNFRRPRGGGQGR